MQPYRFDGDVRLGHEVARGGVPRFVPILVAPLFKECRVGLIFASGRWHRGTLIRLCCWGRKVGIVYLAHDPGIPGCDVVVDIC